MLSATMPAMEIRSIWALSDGAAGNHKQALALAQAIAASAEAAQCDPQVLSATISLSWPDRWLAPQWRRARYAAIRGLPPGPLPEVLIGCGRKAAAVLDCLKSQQPAVRTVQILDPRVDPLRFDLVLVPQHDRLRGDNVVLSLAALHSIDGAVLAQAKSEFAEFAELAAPRQLFLLGASHRHARWDWPELQSALASAVDCGSVMISTSRRTPSALVRQIRQWAAEHQAFCYSGETVRNPYLGMLAWADAITVSPDSVTMLSEACATDVPVFLLPGARLDGKLARLTEALDRCGRLGASAERIIALRETTALAAEVRRRLEQTAPARTIR